RSLSAMSSPPERGTSIVVFRHDCTCDSRDLHSFPTRRSSDLGLIFLGSWIDGMTATTDHSAGPRIRAETPTSSLGASPSKGAWTDRKSTRLNSSHVKISYAVFCLKKKYRYIRHAEDQSYRQEQ